MPTTAGNPHAIAYRLLSSESCRVILIGDSHSPPDAANGFFRGLSYFLGNRLTSFVTGFVGGPNTLVFYPADAYYTKGESSPGDDPDWHGPNRVRVLDWTGDQPNSTVVARWNLDPDKMEAPISSRAIYVGNNLAPALKQNGSTLDLTADGIHSTPWAPVSDLKLMATNSDETGKHIEFMGAQFANGYPGVHLQAFAVPGWQTFNHAACSGASDFRYYTDQLAEETEACTQPPFTPEYTLVIVLLAHDDGGTDVPSFKQNTADITDRIAGIFGADSVLYIHPWYSPTATLQKQQDQWVALCDLAENSSLPVAAAISIAEATEYAILQGLDEQNLHVATPELRDDIAALVFELLGEAEPEPIE